jgi:hypothetical protein
MNTDLVFEAHYGYWVNLANERLWRRVDFLLNFVQLVGGSATVISFLKDMPNTGIALGLGLSMIGALSLLLQAAVKAHQHEQAKCKYLELRQEASILDEAELRRRLADAQRSPAGVRSLANPAYNATLDAMGYEGSADRIALSVLERIVDACA